MKVTTEKASKLSKKRTSTDTKSTRWSKTQTKARVYCSAYAIKWVVSLCKAEIWAPWCVPSKDLRVSALVTASPCRLTAAVAFVSALARWESTSMASSSLRDDLTSSSSSRLSLTSRYWRRFTSCQDSVIFSRSSVALHSRLRAQAAAVTHLRTLTTMEASSQRLERSRLWRSTWRTTLIEDSYSAYFKGITIWSHASKWPPNLSLMQDLT